MTGALARLTRALQATGLEVELVELREIVWLAQALVGGVGQQRVGEAFATPLTPAAPARPGAREGSSTSAPGAPATPAPGASAAGDGREEAGDFYAAAARRAARSTGVSARRVRVRGVPALPDSRLIARALRPLSIRRAVGRPELDARATAEFIAETGLRLPVMRGKSERVFEVVLVVEQVPSMAAWRPLVDELEQLLRRRGGFRAVTRMALRDNGDKIVVTPGLFGNVRGRIVLVASDATSDAWHQGRIGVWLQEMQSLGPMALVQLLPQGLWPNTAVGFAELEVSARRAGQANAGLLQRRPAWARGQEGIVMPVLALEPRSVARWARMVVAAGETWAPAALLPMPGEEPVADIPPQEPAALVEDFRASATPEAQRLAACYSAVRPLTPPVMRVVQQAMLGKSGSDALAQVLLGGLMHLVDGSAGAIEEAEFDFKKGVRKLLAGSITDREFVQVKLAVWDYLQQHGETQSDFVAMLADEKGLESLPPRARPFAQQVRAETVADGGGKDGISAEGIHRIREKVEQVANLLRSLSPDAPEGMRDEILALFDEAPVVPASMRPDRSGVFASNGELFMLDRLEVSTWKANAPLYKVTREDLPPNVPRLGSGHDLLGFELRSGDRTVPVLYVATSVSAAVGEKLLSLTGTSHPRRLDLSWTHRLVCATLRPKRALALAMLSRNGLLRIGVDAGSYESSPAARAELVNAIRRSRPNIDGLMLGTKLTERMEILCLFGDRVREDELLVAGVEELATTPQQQADILRRLDINLIAENPRSRVYISHPSEYTMYAADLGRVLSGEVKVESFEHVGSAEGWSKAFMTAIDHSDAIVAIVGTRSGRRSESEIQYAMKVDKPVIPVFVDRPARPQGLLERQAANINPEGRIVLLADAQGTCLARVIDLTAANILRALSGIHRARFPDSDQTLSSRDTTQAESTSAPGISGTSVVPARSMTVLEFEKSSALTSELRTHLSDAFVAFEAYLMRCGYQPKGGRLGVFVDPKLRDNVYYDGLRIVLGAPLATDTDAFFRECSHHALLPVPLGTLGKHQSAIESGLADYFACSFNDDPRFGEQSFRLFVRHFPEFAAKGAIRLLNNDRNYDEVGRGSEMHDEGEVWGGAFWEMRQRQGPPVADRLLFEGWRASSAHKRPRDFRRTFITTLIKAARHPEVDRAADVVDVFKRRGFGRFTIEDRTTSQMRRAESA